MRLYVCEGTFGTGARHACRRAHDVLAAAGYAPKSVRTYGCYRTDPLFRGRREVKRLTGTYNVPTLVLDHGTVIDGSPSILAWAEANPSLLAEQRQLTPR
jgi:hypothetical protein